jgi:hypothetical protein
MKKVVLSLALLLIISSAATVAAAPQLSEFPIGMAQDEALVKGLVMRDQYGGTVNVTFGGKVWPAALVFENRRLVYVIIKENGDEYLTATDDGLWQIGWLVIYASTERNLVFDAINLAASGKDETAIGEEYERFQDIMRSQNFTNSNSVYISPRVWAAFALLKGENPIEKYPDATICNVTIEGKDVTLVFSTFGYMDKMNRQTP